MNTPMIYSKAGAMVYQGLFNGATVRVTAAPGKPVRVCRVFDDGSTQRRLNRGWQEIIQAIKKQVS